MITERSNGDERDNVVVIVGEGLLDNDDKVDWSIDGDDDDDDNDDNDDDGDDDDVNGDDVDNVDWSIDDDDVNDKDDDVNFVVVVDNNVVEVVVLFINK